MKVSPIGERLPAGEARVKESRPRTARAALRREALDRLVTRFHHGRHLDQDPVAFVRIYSDPGDQEVVGMLAALLAYGRVELLRAAIQWVLERLGPSPRRALLDGVPERPDWGAGFRYRFNRQADLVGLLSAMAGVLREEGGLGTSLASRRAQAGDLEGGLALWVQSLRQRIERTAPLGPGMTFLLPDPARGGACKRWWLYLRWMVRQDDGIDLGTWSSRFPASELIVPLDVHWIRIGRRLGFTSRRTPDGRMAREITDALRRLDPLDPLRFDFAVCHLGIGGQCPPRLRPEHCQACLLHPACPTGRRRAPSGGGSPERN